MRFIVTQPFSVVYINPDTMQTVRQRYNEGDTLETKLADMTAVRFEGSNGEHLVEPAIFNTLLSKCMVRLL